MQTKNTNAAIAVDMPTAVKNAVEAAPSRKLLIAAKAKLYDLSEKLNAESQEIERLKANVGDNSPAMRVQDALAGNPIADEATEDLIQAATIRRQALQGAIQIQTATVRKLESDLYGEVNVRTKSIRQPVVTRLANALAEMRAAAAEDAAITAEVSRNSIDTPRGAVEVGITQNPVMRSLLVEQGWKDAMRGKGYSV
jgi:hypothetical protein